MFFQNITSTDSISAWVARQIDATRDAVKYGCGNQATQETALVSAEPLSDGGNGKHCAVLSRYRIYARGMRGVGNANGCSERILEGASGCRIYGQIIHQGIRGIRGPDTGNNGS